MSAHRRIQMPDAIVWNYAEARLDLARALRQIAAKLWLTCTVRLTSDHSVATLVVDAEATTPGQDPDGQAQGDGGRLKAVA
jgi:hypothetical protein